MNKLLPALTAVLLGSAGVSFSTVPAPVPGPGGVAIAVRDFLRAQDAGEGFAALLADEPHAVDLVVTQGGGLDQVEDAVVSVFADVGPDGSAFAAASAAGFAKATAARFAAGAVRTEIGTIRGSCESERCSWAVFDFVRVLGEGEGAVRVPMHGSALLRYVGGEGPSFRIYQWHVSRAAEPQRDAAPAKSAR